MPEPRQKQAFSLLGFDANHYAQTEGYAKAIDAIYNQAIVDFTQLAGNKKLDPAKPFAFKDYPGAQQKVESIISKLSGNMKAVIEQGSSDQWLYACKKNDAFLNHVLNTSKVPKATMERWQDRNLDALKTFQTRKVDGMDLSKRIWNYSGQMKTQMELGIDIALGEGKSAAQLSRDLRQYLVDPDKLFHKVRNKHGNLVLSKNAAAYHPGQGKYRSSYKNAMRLTRSEINMAYRESDQLRWEKLDFVVGFEVKLSNNHTLNGVPFVDVCDELKGKYPKTFKFKGWHPQCRCHAVPILMDPDEFDTNELNELKAAINDTEYNQFTSKNQVNDVPAGFKEWITDHAQQSQNWKSQPYFIRDNFAGGNIAGGLKVAVKSAEQLAAEKLAAEAAKAAALAAEAEAKAAAEAAKIEAEKAAKAKALLEKTTKMSTNLVAKAEKAGLSGPELDNLKSALEQEGITNAELNKLYKKLNASYKQAIDIAKDPLSKEALLKKYSQQEVDNLFSAYDNFYKTKINNLDIGSKVKKLEFEVDWLGKNGKYSTSGELQKMLQRDLEELKLNFEKEIYKKEANDLVLAHTAINDKAVKSSISELEKVLKNEKADLSAIKTAIGNANKAVTEYNAKNIRTISPEDFKFFENEKDKFSITKFYTEKEKAKVRELRQKLSDEIVKAGGNIRGSSVVEAQKELAEYIYKIQFNYVAKQESIKHIGMTLNSKNEFVFDYVTDKEAKEAFDRYVSSKGSGSGYYSSNVGGVHMSSATKTYTERVRKAGVEITAEATLPSRYFSGSGFINNYIKKSDFSYVTGNAELKQSLHDYVSALSHSVSKLPRHNGISYRGIGYSKDIIDELISCKAGNKPFIHKLGMSTSISANVADGFGSGITFKIYGRSGIYGREFSAYSSEIEVLYRPGSRFEVVEVYQETEHNGIARKGSWTVILREILK